jgi:hypothetical protein
LGNQDDTQVKRRLIKFSDVNMKHILYIGLSYLIETSSTLVKLVVYSNRSNDEQLDTKFTIKVKPCDDLGGSQSWEVKKVRYSVTEPSESSASVVTGSIRQLAESLVKTGLINLIELQSRGVKVSDDVEKMTLYYLA